PDVCRSVPFMPDDAFRQHQVVHHEERTRYNSGVRTDELDFDLPPELIAQEPMPERSNSRLLHYRSADQSIAHFRFSDLPSLLRAGDLMVFNDSRVIPARFVLKKSTGGRIEGLFLQEIQPGRWHVMLKGLGRSAPEMQLAEASDVPVRVMQ